jgi:tetratricopeptide (TPR) repeat protein
MAKKAGRNDPYPCGSGKKYKGCCLEQDKRAESAALASAITPAEAEQEEFDPLFEGEDNLTEASNAAVDLIQAGKLDEAERAARDLLVRFPDVHDGYDRLGMVYEARGDRQKAIECYRKVVELIHAHPALYDPGFAGVVQRLIDKLEAPADSPETL